MIWLFWLALALYVPFHFRTPITECWWSVRNWFRTHTPPMAWGFADYWIGVWKVEIPNNRYKYHYPEQYDWDTGYAWGTFLMVCICVCLGVGFLCTIIFSCI